MPNRLSIEKRRVSYAEWADVWESLVLLANHLRVTPTEIIRKATLEYLSAMKKELEAAKKTLEREHAAVAARNRDERHKRDTLRTLLRKNT